MNVGRIHVELINVSNITIYIIIGVMFLAGTMLLMKCLVMYHKPHTVCVSKCLILTTHVLTSTA